MAFEDSIPTSSRGPDGGAGSACATIRPSARSGWTSPRPSTSRRRRPAGQPLHQHRAGFLMIKTRQPPRSHPHAAAALGAVLFAWSIPSPGPRAETATRARSASLLSWALSTPANRVTIGQVEGALSSNATIRDVRIADKDGVWLTVDRAQLVWSRTALFAAPPADRQARDRPADHRRAGRWRTKPRRPPLPKRPCCPNCR